MPHTWYYNITYTITKDYNIKKYAIHSLDRLPYRS